MTSRYPRRIITNEVLANDLIGGFYNSTEYARKIRDNSWNVEESKDVDFRFDSNANNLFLALPLTDHGSVITGGFYADVSPLIKDRQGLTPGTAKTATSTGNGSQSSNVLSPFTQYTTNLLWNTQTTNSDLFYYSTALNFNTATTIECWVYFSSSRTGYTVLATNAFSGGFYAGASLSINNSNQLVYFTNTGGTQTLTGTGSTVTRDAWNHIAFSFSGSGTNLRMFVNGVQALSSGYNVDTGRTQFTVGASNWDGIPNMSLNRMQDFRIYSGIQKYTGSFTLDNANPDNGGSILS
jgi:hypothetical protein